MSLEETIARRVLGLSYESLDADLLHILKRNIMDSYAGICGSLKDKELLSNFDRLVAGPASGSDLDVWGINRRGSFRVLSAGVQRSINFQHVKFF